MDYEKAYKEALERAKNIKSKILQSHLSTESCKAVSEYIDTIIPELRESEDERMMREFNDWLCEEINCRTNDLRDEKDRRTLNMLCYVLTKVKEWLEKQKEPENTSASTIIPSCWECEQKEHKPAEWSEEDADILNCCISSIEEAKENRYAYKETDGDTSYDREIDWLKSLRPSWKPSDQDELMKLKYAGTSTKLD